MNCWASGQSLPTAGQQPATCSSRLFCVKNKNKSRHVFRYKVLSKHEWPCIFMQLKRKTALRFRLVCVPHVQTVWVEGTATLGDAKGCEPQRHVKSYLKITKNDRPQLVHLKKNAGFCNVCCLGLKSCQPVHPIPHMYFCALVEKKQKQKHCPAFGCCCKSVPACL